MFLFRLIIDSRKEKHKILKIQQVNKKVRGSASGYIIVKTKIPFGQNENSKFAFFAILK